MLSSAREAIRRFGPYCGVRFLKNRGVPFTVTYLARFGRLPRHI